MLHRPLIAAVLLSLAAPALAADANPLHVVLMVDRAPGEPMLASIAPQRLTPTMWLRPSFDLQVAVRDGLTRQWSAGLTPGVGYGIAWCPPAWKFTPELVALDLHASARLSEGTLSGRVLAMLTLGGLLTVGAGLDAALGSGQAPDRYGLAVAAGVRYPL